jgi:hypothetical protein
MKVRKFCNSLPEAKGAYKSKKNAANIDKMNNHVGTDDFSDEQHVE